MTHPLLDTLGYTSSTGYLPRRRFGGAIEQAHVLRRAVSACVADGGDLHGVYELRDPTEPGVATPVVYVAAAPSADAADRIHRRIWNQAAVPFLVVCLPDCARLYSGFRYRTRTSGTAGRAHGLLAAAVAFDRVLEELPELHAAAIDDGTLWRVRADDADPRSRVDWRLLDNLRELGEWLRREGLPAPVAHALIGKFVFLRYLRDREILSERRLLELGVDPRVFGRKMTLDAFRHLVVAVDDWLNGEIFPIAFSSAGAPKADHVRKLADVFLGDTARTSQMHLDFDAYDFSCIPIETLSVIYEQFLAVEDRARAQGAFYTPIAVVNFLLSELQDLRPLRDGDRVFDPSCGSGAFLVQCYRRMIEQRMRAAGRKLRPTELRELLVTRIFGLDRDADACRVTELSLLLTMLDYIEPPDLVSTPRFQLPTLREANVFQGDFFADGQWRSAIRHGFEWVVGNPPWGKIKSKPKAVDLPAANWISAHRATHPVAGRQVAEAFVWQVLEAAHPRAGIALLIPAMSLFCEQRDFRKAFFSRVAVQRVLNLANLRRVLFASRAEHAAAALFFTPRQKLRDEVLAFSPLVANQEANKPPRPGVRRTIWTITLNRSEIRVLPRASVETGSPRPWKLAMWGSPRDRRLLEVLERRHEPFGELEASGRIRMSEGPQLREARAAGVERLPDLPGRRTIDTGLLKEVGRIHVFPPAALAEVPRDLTHVRIGRGETTLAVCAAPHVIVHGGRNWAVFSNDFLIVPPRQIGIAGDSGDEDLLRAIALFLSSDFAIYHQFFDSPQEGVRNGRATLASLRRVPVPFGRMDASDLRVWGALHRRIVAHADAVNSALLRTPAHVEAASVLEREMNDLVFHALGLGLDERWLVDDLVHVRRQLSDGRVRRGAVRAPSDDELEAYADTLRVELDCFLDRALAQEHCVSYATEAGSGMIEVRLVARGRGGVYRVDTPGLSEALRRLRRRLEGEHPQWLYFDRNLFLYDSEAWFICKPMQRFWWTRSQALSDADQLIAETLAAVSAS